MDFTRDDRPADSPFVARIHRTTYRRATLDLAEPDGAWDLLFMVRGGRLLVLQTGQILRPVEVRWEAGDSLLGISFRPEVYMPRRPGDAVVGQGVAHPLDGARAVRIDGERLELPGFDNAEQFVARLAARGLIERDRRVRRIADDVAMRVDDRSLQRHCARVTGLSPKALQQVLRASRARELLLAGGRIADVAAALGYADQSHMTNSLKRLLGRTPGDIARAR
jgi:AraC-like DNA-binding protein